MSTMLAATPEKSTQKTTKPKKKPFIKLNADEAYALNCKLRKLAPSARELYRYLQTVLTFPDKKYAASDRQLAEKLRYTPMTINTAKFSLWEAELIHLFHRDGDRTTIYQLRTTWHPTDKPDKRQRYLDRSVTVKVNTRSPHINGRSVYNPKHRQDILTSVQTAAAVRAEMAPYLEAELIPQKRLSYPTQRVYKKVENGVNTTIDHIDTSLVGVNTCVPEIILRSERTSLHSESRSECELHRRIARSPSATSQLSVPPCSSFGNDSNSSSPIKVEEATSPLVEDSYSSPIKLEKPVTADPDKGTTDIIEGGIKLSRYFKGFDMPDLIYQERLSLDLPAYLKEDKLFVLPNRKSRYSYLPIYSIRRIKTVDHVVACWMQAVRIVNGIEENFCTDGRQHVEGIMQTEPSLVVNRSALPYWRKAFVDIHTECLARDTTFGRLLLMMILYIEDEDRSDQYKSYGRRPTRLIGGWEKYVGQAFNVAGKLPRVYDYESCGVDSDEPSVGVGTIAPHLYRQVYQYDIDDPSCIGCGLKKER